MPAPAPKSYLIDMDGVLVRGGTAIPGAAIFVDRLLQRHAKFLVVTNNPIYSPRDLARRFQAIGLPLGPEHFFTSAMATASFLRSQRKEGGSVFVIGESGLTTALHEAGFVLTEVDPDYVVLGETQAYDIDRITRAIRYLVKGAHFIATNPDPSGPSEDGVVPACGAMAALMERASGVVPFFVGKPNPLMMRTALNYLGVHSEGAVMVGDRMDTDIIGGIQAGMETVLVLSGVTRPEEIRRYSFQPTFVLEDVEKIDV